jgi:hypothetical protein
MRATRTLGALCIGILVMSCKPRAYNQAQLKAAQTQSEVVAFNWSNSNASLQEHLKDQINNAFQKNRTITDMQNIPTEGLVGYGMYTANDPFLSIEYGRDLTCVTIRQNTSYTASEYLEPPEKLLERIHSENDVIVYTWGSSFLYSGRSRAAVVRNSTVIDQSKSAKFSLRKVGSLKGLSPQQIQFGRAAIKDNNLCKALSVYESEFASFVYSLMAVAVDWKTPRPQYGLPLYLIKGPTQNPMPAEFFPDFAAAIQALASDPEIIQEAIKSGYELQSDAPQAKKSEDMARILEDLIIGNFSDGKIQLAKKVFAKSGYINIKYSGNDFDALNAAIFMGFGEKLEQWKNSHPDEAVFMRELWQKLSAASILQTQSAR